VFEFYLSGGWERYPTYRFDVDVRPEWHARIPGYRIRRFDREEDLVAVAEIYAEYNRNSPLSLVRDDVYWRKHFTWSRREREEAFYVAEKEGEVMGYMRSDIHSILEFGYRDGYEDAALALLEAEVRLMRSRGVEHFGISMPVQEPMIGFLRQLRSSVDQVESTLLRIVDLVKLLEALVPDFRKRLKASDHPVRPGGELGIASGGYEATLTVADGDVRVAKGIAEGAEVLRLSQRHLFDLMTGSDEYVPLEVSKPARDLVEILFPKLNPIWWSIDTV
jgi:predicted acetyltransferase